MQWYSLQDVRDRTVPISHESCVVYCIKNRINSKEYVGCTTYKLYERIRGHIYSALEKNVHYAICAALRKYGVDQFDVCVIGKADSNDLNDLEIKLIAERNTLHRGYNMTVGGDGIIGYKYPKIVGQRISKAKKGKPASDRAKRALHKAIHQIDPKTGLIIATFQSYSEAVKITGINNITYCCRGRLPHAGGYLWRYVRAADAHRGTWSVEKRNKMANRLKVRNHLHRSVEQLTLNGNVIATYSSIKEAFKTTGICNISMVCRGARKAAGGYHWRYSLSK